MATIKQILNNKNDKIDSLISEFKKEIDRFSGRLKKIIQSLIRTNKLTRETISGAFNLLGYDDMIDSFIDKYTEMFQFSREISQILNINFQLSEESLTLLEEISNNDSIRLLTTKEVISNDLVKIGLQGQLENKSLNQIIADISENISDMSRRISTEAYTGISNFERTAKLIQFKESGINKFVYVGPNDNVTRPECQSVLNDPRQSTGWTLEEIKNSPVDFIAGGGWNCRHDWLPFVGGV